MPCGLYGKLPVKRDFVAVNTPRDFLLVWEEWLQGGVSASRISLGHDWLRAYLQAPLWRFWMGGGICGIPVAGVMMSSVDGVGRHFPLTVFDCGEAGDSFALPTSSETAGWYDQLEDFLLSALEPEVEYDALLATLELMPRAAKTPAALPDMTVIDCYGAKACGSVDIEGIHAAFSAIETERNRASLHRASYWWTIGGEGYDPMALAADGLPAPHIVETMLTRRFDRGSG